MTSIRDNWPTDADDLVNGIPETVKAAKSMGHVPAAGNDPDAQLRASKALTSLGIEVPDGVQVGPVTPADRRAAVERQNEYAENAVGSLLAAEGWNPVKAAAAVERGEDPADAAREDARRSAGQTRANSGTGRQANPTGRRARPAETTAEPTPDQPADKGTAKPADKPADKG